MSVPPLSVFLIAKNAPADLDQCLSLIRPIADELVVVVDSSSDDSTQSVARSHASKVFVRPFDGFSAMKSFALSQCTREWALNLDTDEWPSPELIQEIKSVISSPQPGVDGYAVNRLPYFLGKPIRHGGWYPDWVLRLVRREKSFYPRRPVHERLEVSGPTARLCGELRHYTVTDWPRFLEKQRRYAALSSASPSCLSRWIRPPAVFLKSAVLELGLLDGWRGLAVAFAQGYYTHHKYKICRPAEK